MNNQNKNDELNLLEAILAKARKVSQSAEVFLATAEELPVHLEANRLKSIRSRQSQSVALRVFKDGRIGYATATSLSDADGLVDSAVATAAYGAAVDFELPAPASYGATEIYDAAVTGVTLETMLQQAQGMAEALTKHTPGLLCEGGVGRETTTVSIVNSAGLQAHYARTEYGVAVEGVLTRATDMLFTGDEASSCSFISDLKPLVANVMRQLDWAAVTAGVSGGKMPVIFTPMGAASALVAPLMTGFNGKTVLEKASPLAGKTGQKLMDEKFSLYDDATLPLRPTSRPFDDEGVASRRLPLVESGMVKGFYYDLKTAALAGVASTGHGQRAPGQPSPTPAAFVIPAGQAAFDDMLADIKEGLVIEQLMGATQGNILGGDFSGNVLLGYKVEHGKIAGRVKDTVVFGNVYDLLKEIAALGSDGRWVGGLFTPSIYFPALSVASKG